MSGPRLAPRSLLPDYRFDYIYVVDLGLAIIVAIFFLFYFNRIFARIVSFAIRKYTWHKYRVYIDFQALQVSPLAGRVFFKGFRYHGRNETVLVNDGYITWRYWLRRVRAASVSEKNKRSSLADPPDHSRVAPEMGHREKGGQGSPTNLPCRIFIKARGLEWYIYNRTPAYDAIMENISKADTADVPTKEKPVKRRNKLSKGDKIEEKTSIGNDDVSRSCDGGQKKGAFGKDTGHSQPPRTSTTNTSSSSSSSSSSRGHPTADTLPIAIQMLPAKLECTKGAIVMGNQHTRSVLTAKFDQAVGLVDARNASYQDLYKQTIDFDFTHPVIQLKANKDFKDSQLAEGAPIDARERAAKGEAGSALPPHNRNEKRTFWDSLRYAIPHAAQSTVSITNKRVRSAHNDGEKAVAGQQRWLGLTRYMDEEDDALEQERWKSVEYGRFSTVVDSPSIGASIRWDVPGQVSRHSPSKSDTLSEINVDINGGEPPDWSIDLRVRGGEIHYGPWADRQRNDLQNYFFPTIHKDATPATPLKVGQSRISTVFKLVVEIEERTTLVIPTREESKDWKWKGRAKTGDGPKAKSKGKRNHNKQKKGDKDNLNPEIRSYGWLDLKISPDSTVSLSMDLVAGSSGYRTNLVLDLRRSEMASSVNHELLWRSESQVVSCDLSNPLGWNTLRQWQIDVQCNKLEIFLLRDHIFLLTDLVNDWSSGPSSDYYTFVPFKYSIGLHLDDFKLFMNANDSNIINNPADIDDNTFVVIWGKALAAEISIPLKAFRPTRNEISFDVGAHDGGFELRTPHWNTQHTFLNDTGVASLKKLKIKGLYDYSTTTSPSLTDILRMEVHGDSPRINLYGFLIRYLMKVKDNYFGEDLHFRTLEEYQAHIRDQNSPNRKNSDSVPHAKISNDLDVILKIVAERSIASLPARLYSSAEIVELDIPSIVADLRFTNYYMDLAVYFSPISVARRGSLILHSRPSDVNSSTQLFIDGLEITGHRLFGLPPTEPTYVCNWDFVLGYITGECSAEFLRAFLSSIRCFGFSFDDDENALPPLNPPVIHDVTFLRLSVQPIEVWLRLGPATFLFSTKEVTLEFNDWAGARFSQQLHLHISELVIAVIENKKTLQEKANSRNTQITQAYFGATADLRMLKRKKDFDEDRQLQQSHLKLHDCRTHRVPWLLHLDQAAVATTSTSGAKMRPPAMQFPPMPQPSTSGQDPIADYDSSLSASSGAVSSRASTHKSSFLTTKSSERGRAVRAGFRAPDESKSYSYEGDAGNKQSWKHVTDGQSGRLGGEMAQTGFAFSSPYKMPSFQLCGMQPDLRDVPSYSSELQFTTTTIKAPTDVPINVAAQGDQRERASLIIDLSQGVRAFCTSVAMLHVEALLDALKLDDLTALLDTLQMKTMAEVVTSLQDHNDDAKIMDLNIRIPFVQARFLNVATAVLEAARGRVGLIVEVENLNLTSRSSEQQRKTSDMTSSSASSVHVALDKIYCSVIGAMGQTLPPKPIMRFALLDPVFWITMSHHIMLDMQLKNSEVLVIPYEFDSLLLLGLNEVKQIQQTLHRYSQTAKEQTLRLRKLVYHLTTDGEEVQDPPFLTRASYVLRSATNHLRTCDSWKMVSRLRYIFNSLSIGWKGSVFEQCRRDPINVPDDARIRVIANFEHWRAWDVTHIKGSSLMQGLYGKGTVHRISEADLPLSSKASIRMRSVRLALETGNTPNDIVIEGLALSFELDPLVLSSTYAHQSEHSPATSSKVQIQCARATACLNWNLCEVVRTVMGVLHQQSANEGTDCTSSADLSPANEIRTVDHKVHAVLALEVCIFRGNSPNLGNTSMCQGVKISSLLSTAKAGMVTSLLVAAEAATSETTDRFITLIQSKLRRPSILATLDDRIAIAGFHSAWKVAASCSELSLKVLQDPLIMIKTVHTLLRDEASYIRRLATSSSSDAAHLEMENIPVRGGESSNKRAHITLVIDSYLVSIAILPSLSYRIAGRFARSTIQHGLRQATETLIDYDIKDHRHVCSTLSRDGDEDIAALDIPPINGRFILDLGPKQKCAIVHTMVESIELDAASVHTLLVTVNRPEVGDLVTGIEREIPLLQQRLGDFFADSEFQTDTAKTPNRPLLYDAHLIVAGLSIHATSPTSPAATRAGRLHFNLGSVLVKGTNKASRPGRALELPELEVHLNTIQANLLRIEAGEEFPHGNMVIAAILKQTSKTDGESGQLLRAYQVLVSKFELDLNAQTPTMVIDIIGHLQNTLKTIELSSEFNRLRTLRRTRLGSDTTLPASKEPKASSSDNSIGSTALFSAMYNIQMTSIRTNWKIGSTTPTSPGREAEDLILTINKIDLSTRRDNAARLLIENLELQMVPLSKVMLGRSPNSALLPEVVFNVAYLSTGKDRRLAFQAAGKSLDLRLTSQFILPANDLRRSIAYAVQEVREATASWNASAHEKGTQRTALLGNKQFASVLIDADFAGAVVYIQGRRVADSQNSALNMLHSKRLPQHGRYNQFTPGNASSNTTLRSPGLAFKIEYKDACAEERSLNAEVKVDASSNVLQPTVVPLIMEISSSVKEMVSDGESSDRTSTAMSKPAKVLDDDRLLYADPSAIFGKCRVNLGLRICKQEFSLTCQPITQVDAIACSEDIYVAVNTVQSPDHGQFYTLSGVFKNLQASVQHAYSRDPTGSFNVESIFVSLMSSKHVSDANGLSIILKISPMKAQINARQLHDFLLFREVWAPPEIRHAPAAHAPSASTEPQAFIVQRYQQIAATGAFPWNATAAVAQLDIQLDLGQSLGRTALVISNLWISSKKSSDWEQNLCLGFDRIGMDSTGRMSGLIELGNLRVRTSIQWPMIEQAQNQTPLVQASLAFDQLRVKAAFDYQAFAIANITAVEFLMYNVRDLEKASNDRLVCIVEGAKVQAFCTATSAAQGLALFQAVERLIQEKQAAYDASLKDIERFLRRRSAVNPFSLQGVSKIAVARRDDDASKVPIRLQTKVIIRLGAINLGVYPSTFFDNQVFKAEARNVSAQFSVLLDHEKIHSSLSLTLGQLRVALSGFTRPSTPKKLGEIAIDEVVAYAVDARGGTILKVPEVLATMQTWQLPDSTHIDYIFKSSFQGNIDVGWNYSRISFLRGMFANHSRALAQRLGKPLPQSAVQITGGPQPEGEKDTPSEGGQEKITALVNVPLSKYQYSALQEPVIDTPKLTQLGDATPPLEWIGLHRERLPNLTHQIVIVSLLEVAKEVEDAYTRILGSS